MKYPPCRLLPGYIFVKTRDNIRYEKHITAPKGDLRNPLGREELEEKFKGLASRVISKNKVGMIVEKIRALDRIKDINELIGVCY